MFSRLFTCLSGSFAKVVHCLPARTADGAVQDASNARSRPFQTLPTAPAMEFSMRNAAPLPGSGQTANPPALKEESFRFIVARCKRRLFVSQHKAQLKELYTLHTDPTRRARRPSRARRCSVVVSWSCFSLQHVMAA